MVHVLIQAQGNYKFHYKKHLMKKYIRHFKETGIQDVSLVGGKNASLGEMYNELTSQGVNVPNGFAITSHAFWDFLDENSLRQPLQKILTQLNTKTYANLNQVGEKARNLILGGKLSSDLSQKIIEAYQGLSEKENCAVAVRSSATAEDLCRSA